MRTGATETRQPDRLRHHYEVEKALANRLMNSSRQERAKLYTQVYDELFEKVLDHPELTRKKQGEKRQKNNLIQVRKLMRYCDKSSSYLEIGAGDCSLALAVANNVDKVFAVEVSNEIVKEIVQTSNLKIVISDGTSIPVPDESIDLTYSNQMIEHLHPDDVMEHLKNVVRCLKFGGYYYCVTPNRLTGPHDISGYFDDIATGLHLREYAASELATLMYAAGFKKVSIIMVIKGSVSLRVPLIAINMLEKCFEAIPISLRRPAKSSYVIRRILGFEMLAVK